jgi:hypothetical protein
MFNAAEYTCRSMKPVSIIIALVMLVIWQYTGRLTTEEREKMPGHGNYLAAAIPLGAVGVAYLEAGALPALAIAGGLVAYGMNALT